MNVLQWLKGLLDPDRKVWAFDKLQHFGSVLILARLFLWKYQQIGHFILHHPVWATLCYALYTAVEYEIAQTDIAYSIRDGSGKRYVGRPGYGFGLLDIAAGMVGAILAILSWLL